MPTKQKQKQMSFVTPKGTAVYPKLNEPDYKFDSAGVFSCRLLFQAGGEGVEEFISALRSYEEQCYSEELETQGKVKLDRHDSVVRMEEDDEGNETGNYLVQAKMKARVEPKGRSGWDQRPKLYDAKRQAIDPSGSEHIGGGSTLRMAFDAMPFYTAKKFGLSLRLKSVQVIDLVAYTPGDDPSVFDEEAGYTYEAPEVGEEGGDY